MGDFPTATLRVRRALVVCSLAALTAATLTVAGAPSADAATRKAPVKRPARAKAPTQPAIRVPALKVSSAPVVVSAATPAGAAPAAVPDGEAAAYVALTNAARSEARDCGGKPYPAAPPLQWQPKLALAAEAHAEEQQAM